MMNSNWKILNVLSPKKINCSDKLDTVLLFCVSFETYYNNILKEFSTTEHPLLSANCTNVSIKPMIPKKTHWVHSMFNIPMLFCRSNEQSKPPGEIEIFEKKTTFGSLFEMNCNRCHSRECRIILNNPRMVVC